MSYKQKIERITTSTLEESDTLLIRSVLGKKVFSTQGDYVGVIQDIKIHKDRLVGVIIAGTSLLEIGISYITLTAEKAILLSIHPTTLLKGKLVFDKDGKKLGKVIEVKRQDNSNICTAILVKKDIFKKPIIIPAVEIEVSKQNIILNKVY